MVLIYMLTAVSGACHSGKTTLLNKIKERTPEAVILSELVRDKDIVSIDELRKRPSDFLAFEEEIIHAKIRQENEYVGSGTTFAIADRSLMDSLYYLMHYLDKSGLTSDELTRYYKLAEKLITIVAGRYETVYLCHPIPRLDCKDTFRPTSYSQTFEFNVIKALVCQFSGTGVVQVMPEDHEQVVKQIEQIYS